MKRFGFLSIALATALTVACNGNARTDTRTNDDTTVGTSGTANQALSASDRSWIQDMLADGNAEIELGRLASERAASPDVKRFAQMMVADHTKAGNELKKIASTYDVRPDASKADDHHDLMDKLSKLHGAEFDREYIKAMVDDHQDAVNDLEKRVDIVSQGNSVGDKVKGTFGSGKAEAERDGSVKPEKADNHADASVNSWAAETLPVVRHHLDEAKQIQDKLQNNRRNNTARNIAPKTHNTHKGLGKARS
jgi:putative membrane protein